MPQASGRFIVSEDVQKFLLMQLMDLSVNDESDNKSFFEDTSDGKKHHGKMIVFWSNYHLSPFAASDGIIGASSPI